MNCPICSADTAVIDSRGTRRRRKCKACGHRFSTLEVLADSITEPERPAKPPARPRAAIKLRPRPMPLPTAERTISTRERIERLREERRLAMLENDL